MPKKYEPITTKFRALHLMALVSFPTSEVHMNTMLVMLRIDEQTSHFVLPPLKWYIHIYKINCCSSLWHSARNSVNETSTC